MSSYPVRPAVIADAPTVADVHAISSQAAYAQVLPADHTPPPADKRRAMWREAIEYGDPQVHVALADKQVVGFVGFDRSRDPKS